MTLKGRSATVNLSQVFFTFLHLIRIFNKSLKKADILVSSTLGTGVRLCPFNLKIKKADLEKLFYHQPPMTRFFTAWVKTTLF